MEEKTAKADILAMPEYYLITFSSASHCIETEKKARERLSVHIIPTPREITASCGMALRVSRASREETELFFQELDVPSQLYTMGSRREDGKRDFDLLSKIE